MAGVSGGGRAIWGNGESSQAAQGGRESSSWGSQACKESQLLLRAWGAGTGTSGEGRRKGCGQSGQRGSHMVKAGWMLRKQEER